MRLHGWTPRGHPRDLDSRGAVRLEKIYKSRAKWLTGTVGENAFWFAVTHQLFFRKGKKIVSVTFSREKNQNDVDSATIARIVESRL